MDLEKAFVCHYYGWTDAEVSSLKFKTFSTYFKSAVMLRARDHLEEIDRSNFSKFKDSRRDEIIRTLKRTATLFEETRVKDYKEVLSNIAKRLSGG